MSERTVTGIVIFDVCDTLYSENTTFGFIRFALRDHLWFRVYDRLLTSRSSPVFLVIAVLERVFRIDLTKMLAVRCLKGFEREELERAATRYVTERLQGLQVTETHERLSEHKVKGDYIVLISSSLAPVVAAVAAQFDVEWHASQLEMREGRCGGRLASDLTGRKKDIADDIRARVGSYHPLTVYTDNLTDRLLVEGADHPVVIIPRNKTRAKWSGVDAEFLFLR